MAKRDVPGDAVGSQVEYQRQMLRVAEALFRLEVVLDRLFEEEFIVKAVNVKMKGAGRGDYMAVVTADGPDGPVVAFHVADSYAECVSGVATRLQNGSFKFKEDQYAK